MKTYKKLQLNKEVITNMDQIKGGEAWWTGGCTDGCSPWQTDINCSNGNCTADCSATSKETEKTLPQELERICY